MWFAVSASYCIGSTTTALPTFYLDGELLFLDNEDQAAAYAERFIVNPHGLLERVNVSACPLTEYIERCSYAAPVPPVLEDIVHRQLSYEAYLRSA